MLQRQPPSRVVGSATSVAPPHTPEARDHHTRATRPASTARVSPAQPWVQAPNTSALARHGDSLCQRRRQSSRNSLHHHDTDSHCQFRPRHNPQLDAATHTHTFAVASSDRYPAAVVRLLFVKAGRAPSRALIRRAQRDRRVPRQLVGGSTTTQGHRTQEEPGTAGAQ